MIRACRLLVAFLALSSPLIGQQESTPQSAQLPSAGQTAQNASATRAMSPAQELVKLIARSDLVLVPVVVTEKSGKHVLGLQKDAFRIEENGKDRVISVFEETKTETLASRPKEASPESHSNFLAGDDHPWRVTIVVLDMINTPWLRQVEAKKQLTDYLLRSAVRDEPTAIFALTSSGLRQLHAFTTDTKVLIEALQKLKLSLSSEERTEPPAELTDDSSAQQQASAEEQLLFDALNDLDATVSANYQRTASRETLSGLTQLAHAFQAMPGRKTLIWATAGFPFTIDDPQSFARQGDDLRPEYEAAWRALNEANIAVYPVDLSALDFSAAALPSANSGVTSSQIAAITGTSGMKSPLRLTNDKAVQQRLTLHAFAYATGGRACVTVSELEKCFAQAVDDSRDYYLLGYYLGNDTHPGWRKLKVKVARDGVRLGYRMEFYVPPAIPDTPELRRKETVEALASRVLYTGLRLTARLLPPSTDPPPPAATESTRHAEFMLGIMGDSITVDRENGNAINFDVTVLAFDSNRKSIASMSQTIATKFNPERLQKVLQTGLGIPEKVELPPGQYEIKFAVRDNLSGLLGTVSVPLELK